MAMSEFVEKMVKKIENRGNDADQEQAASESNSDAAAPTDQNVTQAPNQNAAQAPDPNATQAPDSNADSQNSSGTQSGSDSQNTSNTQEPPKIEGTFVDRSQYPDRNKFIQKEYVDTYPAERDFYKAADDDVKRAKLEEMKNAAAAQSSETTGGGSSTPEKALQSDPNETDKLKNGEGQKQEDISSIVTDSGIIKDSIGAYNDAAAGKTGEKHSNNLAIAYDAFRLASSATGIVGKSLKEDETEENVTGVLGKSLGTVGSILGMSSHADRVRRQNQAISKLEGNVKDNAQNKDEKRRSKLSKDYIRAARAKRLGSGFDTGAGVANIISSGLGLAGDSISAAGGSKTLSVVLGLVSKIIGEFSKGLSLMGSTLKSMRNKKNKDEVVDEYIKAKVKNVRQHGTTQQEGEDLSDNEKQNIVIARLGIKVDDFADKNVREQSKDEIFKRIGLKRVEQAKQDKEFLAIIGLAENASDNAILEALGYAD